MGPALDPHAAFFDPARHAHYFLRYERQCANAILLAEYLKQHPRVKRVPNPGLKSHPQHELARKQMQDFGTIVSIELDGGLRKGPRFAESLGVVFNCGKRGLTEIVGLPPQLLYGGEYTAEQRAKSLVGKGTVRLSIGLEDESDLKVRPAQALDRAFI